MLIKLGGSVITDKTSYKQFRKDVVSRLCREIKDSGKDVIIVHGAGSFGHVLAKEFELQKGHIRDDQVDAFAKVSRDVRELNGLIISELIEAGIPAASIPTGSCFVMDNGRLLIDPDVLRRYVGLGLVPVMFGDVVMDLKKGFGICSGDEIMRCLSDIFSPEAVIFVSDIDGLYDRDPKVSKDAKLITDVDERTLNSIPKEMTVDDVTGGVHAKMSTMLEMCSDGRDCILVNGTVDGRLRSLLEGQNVTCTRARRG
jgi:isopentenyl phosphate kinase